ncbi:hypothetical protein Tco_0731142 [Tanacetum coccineum]
MNERLRKRRIRQLAEDEDHAITWVNRVMHCHKCWETRHNKTRCTNQERPKCAYLKSKGVVFHDGLSRSMPPPTTTPSSSNTMPPPHTSSSSNTMPPHPTPSTSNTMPPPGSNTIAGSNTMPSLATFASTGTNKGKGPLILKKEANLPKVMLLATEVVLWVVQPAEVVLRVVQAKEVEVQAKEVEVLTLCHGKERQFKMDMEFVYEMERKQIANDEDDQFWEDCDREFDQVKEHKAQDKGMPEDVSAGKQPIIEDVSAGIQPMIKDDSLQVGADLPTQESIVEANP